MLVDVESVRLGCRPMPALFNCPLLDSAIPALRARLKPRRSGSVAKAETQAPLSALVSWRLRGGARYQGCSS